MKHGFLIPLILILVIASGCAQPPAQAPPTPAPSPRPELTPTPAPRPTVAPTPTPTPAEFEVMSLAVEPLEVVAGETVSITARVKNVGGIEGTYTVDLTIDGVKARTKVVKVAPRTTQIVTFTVVKGEPGTYNVEVNGLVDAFRVLESLEFTISNLLITPPVAEVSRIVTVTADVTNAGEVEGSYSAVLTINGSWVETKELTVGAGATEAVSFTFAQDATDSYSIEVGGLSGLLIVLAPGNVLVQLSLAYPELHQELAKLPDLEEIDEKDNEAIDDIAYLASNPEYKPAFESMLNEGIKDKRKYCTPLEALLWVAYDREFDGDHPLQDYSVEKLIKEAWENTTASKNYESERWKDFDEVVNRLNSPKLLYIYMMANIAYDYEKFEEDKRTGIEIPGEVKKETTKGLLPQLYTPKEVFERKKGCCYDHAHFQLYCLLQNGYAYDRFDLHSDSSAVHFNARNPERPPGYTGHHTCLYIENSLFYLIDTGRPIISKRGLKGPFVTIEQAAVAGFVPDWKAYRFFDIDMVITKTVWR